jgi:fructokinase
MQKIYTIGESLLDIIFKGKEPRTAKPGGSAFNASITLGRLGAPVHFISEMGMDRVGDLVLEFMEENGVDCSYISRYSQGQTAIALAFLDERNEAEYQFYKHYPARRLEVDFPDFHKDDLVLFGSFYALNPGIRDRMKILLDKAQQAGAIIVYDPNFRSSHLEQREQLIPVIRENMAYATLVRASNEDLFNIFRVNDPDEAWEIIKPFCDALVYTSSSRGVDLRTPSAHMHMEVEAIEPVSTIGAGDTFNAGLLYGLWKNGYRKGHIGRMDQGQWDGLISNAIGFSRAVCMSYDNYLPQGYADHFKQHKDI